MTDIWLVLTWTQFLTFILLGIDNAFCTMQTASQTTDIPNIMCQYVSQSVSRVNRLAMFA